MVIKCIKCKNLKSENQFSIFRNRRNKACIDCRNQNNTWYASDKLGKRTKAKIYYLKNKDKIAEYRSRNWLKSKYSLSEDSYKEMLNSQDFKCAICLTSFYDVTPCVDHNHTTGKVRGLLCRKCNLKLQPLEDIEYRIKAESYLKSKM